MVAQSIAVGADMTDSKIKITIISTRVKYVNIHHIASDAIKRMGIGHMVVGPFKHNR